MKPNYHHGSLREQLIVEATSMISEFGIDGLSLRKLAERVGVSRTAPYHHFKDKNDLLCAIAQGGFKQLQQINRKITIAEPHDLRAHFKQYFQYYVNYATQNPALYDLMFGRTIWKNNDSTAELRDIAHPTFQHYVEMIETWQNNGLLNHNENTLRLSQLTWGMMHGIARLIIDGIYVDSKSVNELADCAVNLFVGQSA
ncbi:TetR/AcrR family transcriptional regulator [Shewanella youngdeokensis]|uniref:TetR/AcrR family transcriptional regulator n=1 Tax=Shewanella youngdeokensis TaxID=2999068 RepID=A0ABZ0JV72_9GAMM|nr:TetR/AcrR family transcriptional regulator [Shewanella sp. DAU334]